MLPKSYKINENLFLTCQPVNKSATPKKVEVPTNHIVVLDCSGSMSYDLPQIQTQLKKKLPKLIGEKDTLSIIWFSGRGQFGTLLEGEPVTTLADLKDVEKAIDRWLRPVGLTGFKEPLEEAGKVVERVTKKNPGSTCSLFFLSDGCDNCWPRPEILKVVEKAAGGLAAATFVEYGYYADRPLLTAMAEKAGGSLIHANAFDKFQPIFEASMAKRPLGASKIEVSISGDAIGGFVWSQEGVDLTTYSIDGGKVRVAEGTGDLWYLSPKPNGLEHKLENTFAPLYAAMSLFSVRMKPEIIFPLLKATGDVKFIEDFASCFGKQKYSEFMDATKAAAFDSKLRHTKGYDPNKVPADDAYTILDLLKLLSSDEANRVLLDHPDFKFSCISRKRVDAASVLTEDEQKQVAEISSKLATEKSAAKLKELQAELSAITAKKNPLKFTQTLQPDGYAISSLTFNEDRPNVSMKLKLEGTVDLTGRLPEGSKIPTLFPTFQYRDRNVVADGLVNMEQLPVRVTKATANALSKVLPASALPAKMIVSKDYVEGTINLTALPVINRQMCKTASAANLFRTQFQLEKARAAQKVYKAYKDERVAKKESKSYQETYGATDAEWLKDQGFTDYSGFSPKMVQAESTDFYVGKALEVSLKGYSKLPSMTEYKKQASTNKFNGPGLLMKPVVEEVEAYLNSKPTEAEVLAWLETKTKAAVKAARDLIFELAQVKFAIVVGQGWFEEFSSLDENSMNLEVDGVQLAGKVEMKEVQVKI